MEVKRVRSCSGSPDFILASFEEWMTLAAVIKAKAEKQFAFGCSDVAHLAIFFRNQTIQSVTSYEEDVVSTTVSGSGVIFFFDIKKNKMFCELTTVSSSYSWRPWSWFLFLDYSSASAAVEAA